MKTFTPPASIDNTGSKDVTQELNDWLATGIEDGTPEDRNIVQFSGSYRVEEGLSIGSIGSSYNHPNLPKYTRSNVLFDFSGSHIYYRDKSYSELRKWGVRLLHIFEGENLSIIGGSFSGPFRIAKYDSSRESWHAIFLSGTEALTIAGGSYGGIPGDFVYAVPRVDQTNKTVKQNTRVNIASNNFSSCGRQAFTINSGNGITIAGNNICGARRIILDCEAYSNSEISDLLFTQNVIQSVNLGFINVSVSPSAQLARWTIDRNTVLKGHLKTRISGHQYDGLTFTNNISSDTNTPYARKKALVNIDNWENVTIAGNIDYGKEAASILTAVKLSNIPVSTVTNNNWIGFDQ